MLWNIICDFDGTISQKDTVDEVLTRFAAPEWEAIEAEWVAGKIGSMECMQRQIALIQAAPRELDAFLDSLEIDPSFLTFVRFCERVNLPLLVASDGVDYFIRRILGRYKLSHLPLRSNHLVVGENGYSLEFPHMSPGCRSRSGNCKCALADSSSEKGFTVLIGDGKSDFCLAQNADKVFAKKSLSDYCSRENIAFTPFEHFNDVQEALVTTLEPFSMPNAVFKHPNL